MNTSKKVKFISNWIKDYANNMSSKAESLVIGISGGIDSSVSSALSAMTGLKTIVLSMPIKQKSNQHDLSLKHQDWLVKNFKNVEAHTINLDELFFAFSATLSKFGSYDILVNNAGIYGPKGKIEDIDWKEWRRAIEVNLYGSVLTCREAIPYFKKQNSGKIIQLSGGGATNPLPGISSYAVSKAGIVRFIETLSEEVKGKKIDINAIAPGPLNTRMLDEIIEAGPNKVGADFYQKSLEQKDTGGTDLSYACDLALFLGSNLSDGITGKLISAVWDNWEEWPSHIGELSNSDVYTLRRIAGRDREIKWGDK